MAKNKNIEKINYQDTDKKENISEDQPFEEYNTYYEKISLRFRTFKIVCVFVLCIFILGAFVFYGELFTYENARYVLRDINQILEEESDAPAGRISFDSDGEMDFSIYRSNLVVAGNSSVKIIGKSGNVKLTDKTQFISPTIETSDKYCIVYSLGAYNLSVYNSVARVADMRFDYPIFDVDVSDRGYIAVMTQSREYRCCVYLYNSDFKLLSTYNKTYYPCSVSISDNSSEVYITTFSAIDGTYNTKLESYGFSSATPRFTYSCDISIPFDAYATDSGNTVLIGEDAIVFLDKDGKKVNDHRPSEDIKSYHFSSGVFTVLLSDNQTTLINYDAEGDILYQASVSDASSAYNFDNRNFIVCSDTLIDITSRPEMSYSFSNVPQTLLYSDGYIYLCNVDSILPVNIINNNGE